MRLHLPTAAETDALGEALARTRPPTAVVHLRGDLGAGKSTLARSLLRALGVDGAIRSPTYTLVERYTVEGGEALHLDLYRIGDPGELEYLGIDGDAATLWLIEWPDRAGAALPAADIEVGLALQGDGREASLTAFSPVGHHWLTQALEVVTGGIFTPE